MTQTTDAALVELLRGIAYVAGPDSQQNGMTLDGEEVGLLAAHIEAQARRIEALEGVLRGLVDFIGPKDMRVYATDLVVRDARAALEPTP